MEPCLTTTPLSTLLVQPYYFNPNIKITKSFYYLKDPVNETTSYYNQDFVVQWWLHYYWGQAWSQASQRALLPLNSDLNLALLLLLLNKPFYKFFSLMWSEAMQMCWNKRNFLQEKRVQSRRTFCVNQHFTILYINIIWKKENSKTRKLRKNSKLQHGQDNVMRKQSMMHLEKASVNHVTFLVWILWCYLMSMRGANFAFDGQLDD